MTAKTEFQALDDHAISILESQGCSAEDWSKVSVGEGFQPERVQNVSFAGAVRIASLAGSVDCGSGIRKPCGIENAYIVNSTIGDGVRIADVGVHLANYDIGRGAVIEDIGVMETRPGATFGNGVEVEPLNEGGGREVILFDRLDSQFAHLLCLHRYRPRLIERLQAIAKAEVAKVQSDRGTVGPDARIISVKRLVDINVGPCAVVDGATSLVNGTVLSSAEAPTCIGCDVQAEDFIVAEGAKVDGGAILSSSFIGQGCQIGRQFSSEGSIFFANCEGFHGEACSVFGGPYTVTHHKSTLLIAGLFSFYNAGSGTNQSNHLYKLGPVHEGRLERGCKTGSFSYLMWPCLVGPFSVVLGKHTRTFDTGDFPFSYLEATSEGRCLMTPGFNLTTVGTTRDGAKWPARDRRKGSVLRDRISFDVFSPLTVGRMIIGSARLKKLQETTDRAVELVNVGGADVKRLLLKTAQKFYRSAIHKYLLDKVVARVEAAMERGVTSLAEAMKVSDQALFDERWVDIGGQMMPAKRMDALCAKLEAENMDSLDLLNQELDNILAAYAEDEWAWVLWAYRQVFETGLEQATAEQLKAAADALLVVQTKSVNLVLNDAAKEFGVAIRTGFGQDGSDEDAVADFTAVRGEVETNSFVQQLNAEIAALGDRVARFKESLDKS